jgi:hypothetical protein
MYFFIFHYRIMEKNHKLWMFFMNTSGQRNRDISIKVMFWEELDIFFSIFEVILFYWPVIAVCRCVDHIGGVIVSVLALSSIDHGFEPRSGQTKEYEIGICCFSAKHASCSLGIMCQSGAACLPADCCFSELAL